MKKNLALLFLLLPSVAGANTLYTNNFTTTEPPDNWGMFSVTSPAEMSAVTFTAAANVGYMAMTATTNTTEKACRWGYNGGTYWGQVTMAFTVNDVSANTNTAFEWGVRLPGTNTYTANCFRYSSNGTNWTITPGGFASTTPIVISALATGDIITTSIGSGPLANVIVKINTATAFSGASNISGYDAGTVFFGLARTKVGFAYAKISNLSVSGAETTPTPTATTTSSPTPTSSPTNTPSPTATKTLSLTVTSTKTSTPTLSPTRTRTSSPTKTPTPTVTKTVTPTPVRTRNLPGFPAGGRSSGW
jgi:hypothetical protein